MYGLAKEGEGGEGRDETETVDESPFTRATAEVLTFRTVDETFVPLGNRVLASHTG
jgi:hypothetical protein